MSKIEVASGHLLSLINEVLDMSRINSGRLSINEEQFWLSDLLHETLTVSKPQMADKHHSFIFKTDLGQRQTHCPHQMHRSGRIVMPASERTIAPI